MFPFNENHYEPTPKVRIINGAFSTETIYGETIVVELNHALNFTKSMEHSLLCVNQARENGVRVNDVPKNFDPRSSFNIYFPEDEISLPLHRHGPNAYVHMRYPSDEDLKICLRVEMMDIDEWNPYNDENRINSLT